MSGRQAFDKLTRGFTPKRHARVDARKAELRAAMVLYELRRARAMTLSVHTAQTNADTL